MTIGELWRRIVHFARGASAADELRDEMQLHIELRAERNRAAGMTDADAGHASHRQFGNEGVARESARDAWGAVWLENTIRDFRHAIRRLAQRPGFAASVIGVLALGIGATTAMFSIVDATMLRPLPFSQPGRLVVPNRVQVPFDPGPGQPHATFPDNIDMRDLQGMHDLFSHVAAYAVGGLDLSDPERPARVKVGVVSGDFFPTLGVSPIRGRTFTDADAVPNGPLVAILSYGLWQRQFGGVDIVGTPIILSDNTYRVIGVMPRGFGFPKESDAWITMTVPNTFATFSAFRGFLDPTVIARLAPGISFPVASTRLLSRWESRFAQVTPVPGRRTPLERVLPELRGSATLFPLQVVLEGDSRTRLLVLLGATALLLLIACANVTNLLLSQAASRRHEIAVRAVLGASRGRIVRQLLTESVVLSAAGTALGVALARITLATMRALIPDALGGIAPATVDSRVLGFAVALALLTGVGFGLWPALGGTREAPAETIKSGGRSATAGGAGKARRLLVGAELALTVVLLVGSTLMLRSFERLLSAERGMKTRQVGSLEMAFPLAKSDRGARMGRMETMLARLRAMPGVAAVGIVNDLPLGAGGGIGISIKSDAGPLPSGTNPMVRQLVASAGYFDALGIPLKRGRSFSAADDSLAPPVAIVSETLAKRYWPGADPIGRTFTAFSDTPVTVIGVVADVREFKLESDPGSQLYFNAAEQPPRTLAIVARGTIPPDALLARMTEAVRAVDPSQVVYNVRMMDEVVSRSVAPRRLNTVLISAFALLALTLSGLGVYAVVSYSVSQRTREFGIRAALGASGAQLMSLVTREMAWVVVLGLAVGVAGAWALSKLLTSLIYGVTVHDPWSFTIVPVVIIVPALLAAMIPARQAMRVNPADVMRAD